ncbi:hypothetical protein D9758_013412 [Tetrapyrgos nigripes]|uniref:Uncharacterized protein n=1 Tax=Tetrapyrgos nigripes TaxID=182062 RepID=A0A8H5CLR3_9AGAR|nr:hypothetical protein D9758_013412 [Tetrapyrgos nigripes]
MATRGSLIVAIDHSLPNMNSLPLDDDVLDRILTFSPSFETLSSVILTSKVFYNVFSQRSKSIVRAVAHNVVGPALPQALRVIRYQLPGTDDQYKVYDDLPGPESDEALEVPITPAEAHGLAENASVVAFLENLYSLRHKDIRFRTSQLTSTESHRFCRAVYRIALYHRVFSKARYSSPSLRQRAPRIIELDPEDEDTVVKTLNAAKESFVSDFSTEELYQIQALSFSLQEAFLWLHSVSRGVLIEERLCNLDNDPRVTFNRATKLIPPEVSVSPAGGFASNHVLVFSDLRQFLAYPSSNPVSLVLCLRGQQPPTTDSGSKLWGSLLDSSLIQEEDRHCDQCGGSNEPRLLYGPTTYYYLSGVSYQFRPSFMHNHLKGQLKYNLTEVEIIRKYTAVTGLDVLTEDTFTSILHSIHEDGYKRPEFESWKKEDWLCTSCMVKILEEHLHLWLLHMKRKDTAGEEIPEDCGDTTAQTKMKLMERDSIIFATKHDLSEALRSEECTYTGFNVMDYTL